MSVLAFAGAEIGGTGELSSVSGITADGGFPHGGGKYSFRVSAGGSGVLLFAAHSTPVYFRGYMRYPGPLAANSVIMQFQSGAGANQAGLRINLTGLTLRLTGVVNVDGTTPVAADTWHRIEMLVHQNGSTVTVRLNGRQEIYVTGWSIPAAIAQLSLRSGSGFTYWDDVHVTEDNWPGPGYVYARQGKPGTPTYDAFTKVGGTLPVIWSETPFGAGGFANSTAADQTQTMKTESFSEASRGAMYGVGKIEPRDQVYAAQVVMIAKRSVLTTSDHYIARVIGGTLTLTLIAPTTADAFYSSGIFTATLAQLNSAEIGGARGPIATATSNLIVEDVWLMVSALAAPRGLWHYTGMETGGLGELGAAFGTVLETGIKRTGGYAVKITGAAASAELLPPALAPIEAQSLWVRAYIYFPSLPTAAEQVLSIYDANANIVAVSINPTGNVRLMVNGVVQGIIRDAPVRLNTWHRVELCRRGSVQPGDGYAALRFDGVERSWTGETGGVCINTYLHVATNAGYTLFFDDIAVSDMDWIGAGRCVALQGGPDAPTDNAWALTGGATTQAVWSTTPYTTATYAQASAINQAATMRLAAHGLSPTACVVASRIVAVARLVATGLPGGPHALRRRLGTIAAPGYVDTPLPLASTTDAIFWGDVFAAVPLRLITMELGGSQGELTPLMRIAELWLMIEYTELEVAALPPPSIPRTVALIELDVEMPVPTAVLNPSFETWTVPTLPDSWFVSTNGTYTLAKNTTLATSGVAAAALTLLSNNYFGIYQRIDTNDPARPIAWWRGKTVRVRAKFRTLSPFHSTMIQIFDDVGDNVNVQPVPQVGTFTKYETPLMYINPAATYILVVLYTFNIGYTLYIDDVEIVAH